MLGTGCVLLLYVTCFTVMKFRRVAREKVEYEKIMRVVKDLPPEEAARRLGAQNAEKDFLNGKVGGQPLNQIVSLNKIRMKSSP